MMFGRCENCGSRISGGLCLYCDEELIIERQAEELGARDVFNEPSERDFENWFSRTFSKKGESNENP